MDRPKQLFFGIGISIALITGLLGFHASGYNILESLYLTVQLFVLEADISFIKQSLWLKVAYFLAPVVTASAIINFILFIAEKKFKQLKIKSFDQHVIFCGLGLYAEFLIKDFVKEKYKVVVIEKNKDHPLAARLERKAVIFLEGDAKSEKVLLAAGILRASYVLIFTSDDLENLSISNSVSRIVTKDADNNFKQRISNTKLKALVHLEQHYDFEIFKNYHEVNLNNQVREVDFHAVNIYNKAAAAIVEENSPDQFISIESEKDSPAHILVLGFKALGQNVLMQAAHLYHFANLSKLKVTLIDDDIDQQYRSFLNDFPNFSKIIDIQLIEHRDFFEQKINEKIKDISVAFICLPDDGASIFFYKKMRQVFFSIHRKLETPRINIILPQNTGINRLFGSISKEADKLNAKIYELMDTYCNKKLIIDDKESFDAIAMQIHNLYLANHLEPDDLLREWEALSDSQKDFNRYSARHFNIKMRYIGGKIVNKDYDGETFEIDSLEDYKKLTIAKMEHNRWTAEKLLTGFVPGDIGIEGEEHKFLKNVLKFHKDIRPWEELNQNDKDKDFTSFKNIKTILKSIDKKVITLRREYVSEH